MVDVSIDTRGVATLALSNPEKHNILTPEAMAGLT